VLKGGGVIVGSFIGRRWTTASHVGLLSGDGLVPISTEPLLDAFHILGGVGSHLQFGMVRGKNEQTGADAATLRHLLLNGAVGEQKNRDIEADEGEGDVGLPTSAHVFVAQRNEHDARLLGELGIGPVF